MTDTDPLVSDYTLMVFQYVCLCSLSQLISVGGAAGNIINMVCFIKQGFKDSMNVSLFGLAICDLGSLLTSIWLNISVTPDFIQQEKPYVHEDIQYLTASWPHVVFSRISSFITAFVTLERCLCVVVPLKVKLILPLERVIVIIVSCYIIVFASVIPVYCSHRLAYVNFVELNMTLLAIVRTENHISVLKTALTISFVLQFVTYISVIVCTGILVCKLQSKTKWRQGVTSTTLDTSPSRDVRVGKMVATIATVFIVCFIPICVTLIISAVEPQLAIDGLYKNTLLVMFGTGTVLESVNSSVNILVYYNMSSKYRNTFRQIFGREVESKNARHPQNT